MKEKITGIVVFLSRVGEDNFFIGIVTTESIYKKFWFKKKAEQKIYLGLKINGMIFEKNLFSFIFIESCEDFLGSLFWKDYEKLIILKKIMSCFEKVPENIIIEFLYQNFLNTIKSILKNEEKVVENFEKKIQQLIE